MNTIPIVLAAVALAVSTPLAGAQSATEQSSKEANSNQDSMPQKTEHIGSQDKAAGNDLSAHKKDAMKDGDSDPAKTGRIKSQDNATGNNLQGAQGAAAFDKLDTKKTGKVTMADAKHNAWLSKNFKKCDIDSDGSVTRDEYEACKPGQ